MNFRTYMELFDTQATFAIKKAKKNRYENKFKIGDVKYTVYAQTEDGLIWDVEFNGAKQGSTVKTIELLNTGNAGQVFSYVLQWLQQFVMQARPLVISFSAAEPSRRSLYARMISRLIPPGYVLYGDIEYRQQANGYFNLVRRDIAGLSQEDLLDRFLSAAA